MSRTTRKGIALRARISFACTRVSIYRSQRTPVRVKAAYRDTLNEILPRRGRVPRHGFVLVKREESRPHRENRKTRGNEGEKGEQFCFRDEAKESRNSTRLAFLRSLQKTSRPSRPYAESAM